MSSVNNNGKITRRKIVTALAAGTGGSMVGYLAAGATARTVEDKLNDTLSLADFGAVPDNYATDQTAILDSIVSNIALAGEVHISVPAGIKVFPQNIADLKTCGKSVYVEYFDPANTGLQRSFQHNQGPYGAGGVADHGYSFLATDHAAMIIESASKDTTGNSLMHLRPDGKPRPDRVSYLMRKTDFDSLPRNSFQLTDVRQAQDDTLGVEQPSLDGVFLMPWSYDTNSSSYSIKTGIYLEKFTKENSKIEANRTGANMSGRMGFNTYDPKGYRGHIQDYEGKALLVSSNGGASVKQTFLIVDEAPIAFNYDQVQKASLNTEFKYLAGGTYGRSFYSIRKGLLDDDLGTDHTNGVMFSATDHTGDVLKSRVVAQQFEFGTSTVSVNPIFTHNAGTPEGVISAPVGSVCMNTAGGVGTTLYVKEAGTGNTGWAAK